MKKCLALVSKPIIGSILFFITLFPVASSALVFQTGTYKYAISNNSAKMFSNKQAIDGVPQANLGFGYSTDRGIPTVPCIYSGTTTYGGSGEGLVEVARSYSLNEVKRQLHLSTDAEVDLGFFSASVTADFVRDLEQDDYSESFTYRTWIKLKNSIYNPPEQGEILNRVGKAYQNDPDMFRYVCGDRYVDQMEWGGYLYVAVKFIFNSLEDKQAFNAEMSTSFGDIFEMSGKLATATAKINKNGAIKLQAVQIGGDPTKLGKILGGDNGEAPIVYCTFDDLSQCKKMLDRVIVYATSSKDDNFPTQIKIGGPDIPISAANTDLDLLDYLYLGVPIHADSKVTPEIKDARKKLAKKLEEVKSDEGRATFLMGRFAYAADYITKLQNLLQNLQKNEGVLADAGVLCFTELDKCVANAESVLNNLQPVNRNLLQQPSEQLVNVVVNGSVDWNGNSWATDDPKVSYDLKTGAIVGTNYNSISTNGARLDRVPTCDNTNIGLIYSSFYEEIVMGMPMNLGWRDIATGTPAIQQQLACGNNYIINFGGLGQGNRVSDEIKGMNWYWKDAYNLTYRIMHYEE